MIKPLTRTKTVVAGEKDTVTLQKIHMIEPLTRTKTLVAGEKDTVTITTLGGYGG